MSIQNAMRNLKVGSASLFQRTVIFTILIGGGFGPLVLFAISGRNPSAAQQPGLSWLLMAVALLLMMGIGIGLSIFRREAIALSINPKRR